MAPYNAILLPLHGNILSGEVIWQGKYYGITQEVDHNTETGHTMAMFRPELAHTPTIAHTQTQTQTNSWVKEKKSLIKA